MSSTTPLFIIRNTYRTRVYKDEGLDQETKSKLIYFWENLDDLAAIEIFKQYDAGYQWKHDLSLFKFQIGLPTVILMYELLGIREIIQTLIIVGRMIEGFTKAFENSLPYQMDNDYHMNDCYLIQKPKCV